MGPKAPHVFPTFIAQLGLRPSSDLNLRPPDPFSGPQTPLRSPDPPPVLIFAQSRYCFIILFISRLLLAVHWHSWILRFYPSASARKPSKSGPGGPDSSPPDPWKPSFSLRGVDDFSPGLEGRVGDQLWHPWGVQVKAPNSRILISPPSNGPLSTWGSGLPQAELKILDVLKMIFCPCLPPGGPGEGSGLPLS